MRNGECRMQDTQGGTNYMMQNYEKIRDFEKKLLKKPNRDLAQKYAILEAMYQEAVMFGIFPLKNPMEGVETDIKIAKAVNSV